MQKKGIKLKLALIDDAKAIVNDLTKKSLSLGEESRDIIIAKAKLTEKILKLREDIPTAKKIVSEFNKQLKDLGVTGPTGIVTSLAVAIEKAEKMANDFEDKFFK